MDYIIQKKLNEVLEKLQSRVNEGNLNQNLKEEAIKIITKIRLEYKNEIEEYFIKKQSIEKKYIDKQFIFDQSFMVELVSTKKDLDDLRLYLLFLHKSVIIDDNVRWEERFLQLVELFFNRKDNEFSKVDFFRELSCYRFKNEDRNSKFNIDINYILRENAFYSFIKEQIINEPKLITELLIRDIIPEFDRDKTLVIKTPFLLELSIAKFEILKYIPDKFKEDFLINLLSFNENLKAKEYLNPTYKNNNSFCELFEL
jgi:hypothetical protein